MIDPSADFAGQLADMRRRIDELERHASRMPSTLALDSLTVGGLNAATFDGDTYVPTFTGMNIGTGGSARNDAEWEYVGGPNSGDRGLLTIHGAIVFGTSGQTFPTTPTISMPSGFELVSTNNLRPLGQVYFQDDSTPANNRLGTVASSGAANTMRFFIGGFTGGSAGLSTGSPFTWAANDAMLWSLQGALVERT